jgi:simple sugar transport system permease protein
VTVPSNEIQQTPPPELDDEAGGAPPAPAERYTKRRRIHPIVFPLIAFAIMVLLNWQLYLSFSFADGKLRGSLIDVMANAAPVTLLALGMTLVIATGGIDLSVGAIMALAGTVAAILISHKGWPVPLAIGAAIGAGLLAGAWNGFLVAVLRIQPLVATLVLMVAGRGVAQLLSDGQKVPIDNAAFAFLDGGFILGLPFPIWVSLLALLALVIVTRRTAIGLFIESVGDNPTAARYAGVHEVAVKFSVYVISGFFAAVAGLVATSDITEADASLVGLYRELDAILAVVIGGTALTGGRFYLLGSVIGALIVQIIQTTILSSTLPVEMNQVIKAAVVVAVALLQSPTFLGVLTAPFKRKKRF